MATTAANVRSMGTGGIYKAPAGTALPTDAATARDAAFVEVGYVREGGITENQGTSSNKIRAWQNGDAVRTVQTEHDLTYQFGMLETHDATLEAFYGNVATAGGETVVEINGDQLPQGPWIIEMFDGQEHIRLVVPDGQITDREEVSYDNEDATAYGVTLECYPDASNVKAYRYQRTMP